VPAAFAERVAAKLRPHGIHFRRLDTPTAQLAVAEFRADTTTPDATSVEGRQRLTVTGAWRPARHDVGTGALFVPVAQPKARLLLSLLEPAAPDSLLAWGDFANAFEQKEYMEDYVAEAVARGMLAEDPELRATFEAKLREDPGFAASPARRLEFFYRRHASWDAGFNLYPVLRTDVVPD
jgi:hypothetical protein